VQLEGVAAIVTGGGSGLGAASARALAVAGARVTILDRTGAEAERIAAEVEGFAVVADHCDADAVAAALESATERHGPARVLVNCAGEGAPGRRTAGPRGAYPLDLFRRQLEVNVVGPFNCARLAAQAMTALDPLESGERGVIVNTASVNAFDGPVGSIAYTTAKAAIVGMTLPMARDLAPFGVRVCTIAPGSFATPMLTSAPAEMLDDLLTWIPFPNRFGDPAEFAALVRHLCENPMVNGETIRIDAAVRMAQH
jgi:NAD(P)-dependent dehydrogenase (short-subunit alcohol dehydrogenase family)